MIDRDERADTLEGLMRVALWILLFAACSGTGLDIEIFVPDGAKVDRVELWVAYEYCGDCPNGIAWTQNGRATGDILYLRDERLIKAEPRSDRWVLHLDADPDYSEPHSIAVVGYDGTKVSAVRVLREVFIPTSSVQIWQVDLKPATPATTDVSVGPDDPSLDHRAHVWARGPTNELPDPTGCLVYQKWTGSTWETEYFVPKTDPDCDGYTPDKECSNYWVDYKPASSRCVSDTLPDLPGACRIGVAMCADGVTNDTTCRTDTVRPITCLPDSYCDKCSDEVPADTCIERATAETHVGDALAHFDCRYDVSTNGQPCLDQYAQLQLPFRQAACGTIYMHYLDRPFTDEKGELVFGDPGAQVKFKAVLNAAAPCLVHIFWLGGPKETFKDGVTFLLETWYDNGTRAFYPVWLAPQGSTISCTATPNPPACTYQGPLDDHFDACAQK